MKRDETFLVRETCPTHYRAQYTVRVNREEPPGDLKENPEPTVSQTLLQGTLSQVLKYVGDARCVVVSAQAPSSRAALYPFDIV